MSKVLLVDDAKDLTLLVIRILSADGIECEVAADLKQAKEMLANSHFDTVVIDWELPDGTGLEVLQILKESEKNRDVPAMMFTSHKDIDRIQQALETGAIDYITKPCNRMELSARVKVALRLKKAQDELKALAHSDTLTGLYNRRYFVEKMEECIQFCNRYHRPYAFVMMDIDYFKRINDEYGHVIGDLVLKQVAERLQSAVRTTDVLCRLGGEEIGIIFRETLGEEAVFAMNRIYERLSRELFGNDQHQFKVTLSAGLVICKPGHHISFDQLYRQADELLYQAKDNGRGQYVFSDYGSSAQILANTTLRKKIS